MTVLPTGKVLNDRAKQKVRRQEQGHDYVESHLVRLGARSPQPGEDMTSWLAGALRDVAAVSLRHRGNHRYLFPLGRTARTRARVPVLVPDGGPYPKAPDPAASTLRN